MFKHLILSGVAMAALAATTPSLAATQAASPAVAKAAAAAQFGKWGVDMSGMDTQVKPGDSFFEYVNGGWARTTEIPADRSSWGSMAILRDLSDQRTREIIESAAKEKGPKGSVSQKVGDLYASFMDEATIEAKGTAPLKPYLAKIDSVKTASDLARLFGEFGQVGIGTPVGAGVEQDLRKNDQYAVYLGQGGLGMPDRDYYLDAKHAAARDAYVKHVGTMMRLAGLSDPEARAKRVVDLETKIATAHWSRVEQRQLDKLYNPTTLADLEKRAPGFDWKTYLAATGIPAQQNYIMLHPSAIEGAAKLVQSEPLQAWKDYLAFQVISDAAAVLPKAFVDESFAFNGKTLQGTPQLKDRWKRGVDLVGSSLGEAVGELYVAKYFPPESKAKMDVLVGNLIKAMDNRLAHLEWMSPETRVKARAKLASFTPKIGYPDKWRDYSSLEIIAGDALGNAERATRFEYLRQVAKLGKPVDRSEWLMSPQTVNAYANPLLNEIVFPAAILQAPYFDPKADDAANYGAIGAVIGHEITHHFDDQGRKFDATGNMVEWWTAEDAANFKKLTDQVVKQYGEYEPVPGHKVNGELTLGENIADLAGLRIAYDAYKMSLGGKEAPVIDGYTGDQRFFLAFGQAWRAKVRDAAIQQQLATDPHTPAPLRSLVVRNFDEWYKAFDVKDGKLYLTPEQRLKVW
ncbi:M13 family metallopeptidase [Allosphingosinicella vermicomposti]|uniref:M13 family metallopeptidase n=1 Tax=Allosphingosinicella vermicomposti TaxID=614671 RepID=UPI0018F89336|nr:M13-type metalloendopeptidase [Allosphingosinicella vermicomposti]